MTQETQAERGLKAMLDIQWNTNWSELPTDAEAEVEQAYEHLSRAQDIANRSDATPKSNSRT